MSEELEVPEHRVPKQKHYPFGTPSHLNPPYSAFAHLSYSDRDFAHSLAQATNIEAEVRDGQEEEKSKELKEASKRKGRNKTSKKVDNDDNDEEQEKEEEIPNMEGMEPCARPACLKVLTAIFDLQKSNDIEREDMEEEFDYLQAALEEAEQEQKVAEINLFQATETTNQLELSFDQLMKKIETLEKATVVQQLERSENNNKIMTLEIDKRKIARNLELAKKALTNATWRKKKKNHDAEAEAVTEVDPLSASSPIADQVIHQKDAQTIKRDSGVVNTYYGRLVKPTTMDSTEVSPTVKSFSYYLREKLIYEPERFDKIDEKYYNRASEANKKSREVQDEVELKAYDLKDNDMKYSGVEAKRTNDGFQKSTKAMENFKIIGGRPLWYADPDGSRAIKSLRTNTLANKSLGLRLNLGPPGSAFGSEGNSTFRTPQSPDAPWPMSRSSPSSPSLGSSSSSHSPSTKSVKLAPLWDDSGDGGSSPGSRWGTGDMSFNTSPESPTTNSPTLHAVFVRERAQSSWGRTHKLGKIRTPSSRHFNTSRTLTAHHPGMDSFQDAITMLTLAQSEIAADAPSL